MLELRKIWHTTLFILGGALILLAVATQYRTSAESGSGQLCTPQGQIVKPIDGSMVDGPTHFEAYFPVSLNVYEVNFVVDGTFLGGANQINDSLWRLPFDSNLLPSDSHDIRAKAFYGNTADNNSCVTQTVEFITDNGSNSGSSVDLELFVVPVGEWIGPTNVNITFEAQLHLIDGTTNVDVSNQAVFNWTTDIGHVQPNGKFADFFSGPQPGEGKVRLTAFYSGEQEHIDIDIHIEGADGSNTYPSVGDPNDPLVDPDESSESTESETLEEQAERRAKIRELTFGDPGLEECLAEEFGAKQYKQLISSEDRLTFDELSKSSQCFGGRRFVIPANLAPVDPDQVTQLKEASDRLKTEKIEQAKDESGQTSGIVLSGTADPDALVVIYIFSDPLVLTTVADASGNWSYTLEDPLESGDHEVFITVEDESGDVVRSSSFGFSIAQAASTDENPTGLSLALTASNDNDSTIVYIAAAVAVVVLALGAFLLVMKMKNKPKPQTPESSNGFAG